MISIVEDDESTRESVCALVRALGFSTRTFSSAENYLRSGFVDDTDCLIADIHMPGLSGIELHEQLVREGRRVPVIFITGYPDEKARTRVLNAGATGYLSKPFNDDDLVACLDAALAE